MRLNNIAFADDEVLLAENKEDLKHLAYSWGKMLDIAINEIKTKYLWASEEEQDVTKMNTFQRTEQFP